MFRKETYERYETYKNRRQLSLRVKGMFRWREVSAEKREISGAVVVHFYTLLLCTLEIREETYWKMEKTESAGNFLLKALYKCLCYLFSASEVESIHKR